ncbi:MAG: hypothetical protein IJT73_11210 [Selenomonadaceae bacterium]|nr:hypothetical protein [Selenomonadaceae bacterium]
MYFFENKLKRLKNFLLGLSLIIFFVSGSVSAQGVMPSYDRVTVIVLEDDGGRIIRNELATTFLNAKLLEMGFKHVVDASHVINLNNAQLLNYIYRSTDEEFERSIDNVVDYLVLVKSNTDTNTISFLDYDSGRMMKSPLKSAKANFRVNVIVYDTGEIIGAFNSKGVGFANNNSQAGDKAIEMASNDAAEKLADILKKSEMQTAFQLSFKIFADDEKNLEQILEDLNKVSGIQSVHIYEQSERSAVLSIDSYQTPREIVKQLKDITFLKVHVDRLSGSSCELIINDEEELADEKNFDDANNFGESELYPDEQFANGAGGVAER